MFLKIKRVKTSNNLNCTIYNQNDEYYFLDIFFTNFFIFISKMNVKKIKTTVWEYNEICLERNGK